MAEPGEPDAHEETGPAANVARPAPDRDFDDEVGFASPAHLHGRPAPRVEAPILREAVPELEPEPERPAAVEERPANAAAVEDTPAWARETPRASPYAAFGREDAGQAADVPGGSSLLATYALILFAVPTLGVSALIALLAVTGRAGPGDPIASSHFVFQQRTLWAGGLVALSGAILIAVGLGVFVLFALAVWLILRGAVGVLKLKAGRPIANPRAWLF